MIEDALVIVPAFNEAQVIEETLSELRNFAKQVLVVDDGSKDETGALAKKMGVMVIRHSANLGYGAALKSGFAFARRYSCAPYFLTFDADGQHNPIFLDSLLEPLRKGEADYVLGSRFLGSGANFMPPARKIGGKLFGLATSALIGRRITDPTSGMVGLTREVAKVFLTKFFPLDFPDADVLIMLSRMGYRILEVPVEMRLARRPGSMHSGWLKPAYYLAKMSVSMIHFSLRRDLKEKRREIESVF